ncbi:MAG: hypothetical protein JWQ97_2613, partial [Phenylobacterium sp.]|nr:hypothetical protein [Phenylobacterium sp.]
REPGVTDRIALGIEERAVRLDDKPVAQADEVRHGRSDRELAAKLEVFELASPK